MVFKRLVESDITKAENCKVAVYSCPLDSMQTETKVNTALEITETVSTVSTSYILVNYLLVSIISLLA